ncbi:MAG: hypothetical protein KDA89_03465 [Planctomycetaceae bacterium]|nr:hypothetical protein [Planctomycetaceae bacterium]
MGDVIAEFGAKNVAGRSYLFAIWMLSVPIGWVYLILSDQVPFWSVLNIALAFGSVVSGVGSYQAYKRGNREAGLMVELYADGLVLQVGGDRYEFPWQRIAKIEELPMKLNWTTNRHYIVHRDDDEQWLLSNLTLDDPQPLIEILMDVTQKFQIPWVTRSIS